MTILNVGLSGLNAAQMGILTTSHNIANASTPGFSRQQIVQTTNEPMFTGAGYLGQGTSVLTVERMYNQYVTRQMMSSQSGVAEMDSYLAQIQQLDNLLADPDAGVSPALSAFFKGVQDLAANPSSIPARQATLSAAQSLVARFQGIDRRITEIREGVNQQITDEIGKINAYATQLGEINQRVINSQAAGANQTNNDLLDQRDQLIADLNREIGTFAVQQGDGTYSVFFGSGQPLVVGTVVNTLQAVQDVNDPERIGVALTNSWGGAQQLPESVLTGGSLGGLVTFRAQSLDSVENALGRIAIGLAQTFNDIHRLGQDLGGDLGGDFFTVPSPVVKTGAKNTSSAMLSAQIVSSDYQVSFGAAGAFNVYRLTDAQPRTAIASGTVAAGTSVPLTLDGIPVTIAIPTGGAAGNGDRFLIRPGNPPGNRVIAESDNTGNAVLDSAGSNIQALAASDYRLDVTAAGGGSYTFRLTRLSDSQTWSGTGATTAAALADLAEQQQVGFNLTFSGAPNLNDSFLIQPTRVGARNMAVAVADVADIAAGMPMRTSAALTNTGTARIDAGTVFDRSNLPLTNPISLTFNATTNQFEVDDGGGGPLRYVAYDPTLKPSVTININGFSFTIQGPPKDGDTFTVSANANGVADNRTAQLLGGLQTLRSLAGTPGSTTSGATATFQDAYAQIVSQVGNKTREIEVTGKAQQTLADQAQTARDRVSAVNLDEEASRLLQYQQAYQAAAKLIEITGKLFDEILAMAR